MSGRDIDIDILKKKIEACKMKLVVKAKKQGLYENFGQAEGRQLDGLALNIIHDGARPMEERQEASKLINEFHDWAETYECK